MVEKNFSFSEAIDFGWDCMKKNLGFFVSLLVFLAIFSFVSDKINKSLKDAPWAVALVIATVLVALNLFVNIGLVKISLNFAQGKKGGFSDFLGNGRYLLNFLGASILYGLITLAGFILLIVPGVVWSVQFGLYSYLIIDRDLGVIGSLKKSSLVTRGAKGRLLVFYLLLFLVNFAGVICLIIGLFATIPTTMIAAAYVYKKLLSETEKAQAQAAEAK